MRVYLCLQLFNASIAASISGIDFGLCSYSTEICNWLLGLLAARVGTSPVTSFPFTRHAFGAFSQLLVHIFIPHALVVTSNGLFLFALSAASDITCFADSDAVTLHPLLFAERLLPLRFHTLRT